MIFAQKAIPLVSSFRDKFEVIPHLEGSSELNEPEFSPIFSIL